MMTTDKNPVFNLEACKISLVLKEVLQSYVTYRKSSIKPHGGLFFEALLRGA